MGVCVMVLGESGSGKSTSLRNFEPEEVGIYNVTSKPLPFRKKLAVANNANYGGIMDSLRKSSRRAFVIDDSQFLMANDFFEKATETGYGKFTDIAVKFKKLLQLCNDLPQDKIIYFLHHVEHTDTGRTKAKTIGKMLDNQLTVEGLFPIVLLCKTDGQRHWFETQSDGFTTVKSPMDMFPPQIDNDLKFVDSTIRDYWGLAPITDTSTATETDTSKE